MKRILVTALLLISIICISVVAGSGQGTSKDSTKNAKASDQQKSASVAKKTAGPSTIHIENCRVIPADKHMHVPTGPVYIQTNGPGEYLVHWNNPSPFGPGNNDYVISRRDPVGPLDLAVPIDLKNPVTYSYVVYGWHCEGKSTKAEPKPGAVKKMFGTGTSNRIMVTSDPNDIIVP
jgi:hypothetical protein